MIEIIKVNTKALQKEFVEFQYELYRDCKQFVPPFKNDIYAMMNEKKHPFYDHSISEFFLAKQDGRVVGKLSMLINRPFNEYHHTKDSEFYLFDCIDDQEVANALFGLAEKWTLEHGMNRIVGQRLWAAGRLRYPGGRLRTPTNDEHDELQLPLLSEIGGKLRFCQGS